LVEPAEPDEMIPGAAVLTAEDGDADANPWAWAPLAAMAVPGITPMAMDVSAARSTPTMARILPPDDNEPLVLPTVASVIGASSLVLGSWRNVGAKSQRVGHFWGTCVAPRR
jgi:hypothetical protein